MKQPSVQIENIEEKKEPEVFNEEQNEEEYEGEDIDVENDDIQNCLDDEMLALMNKNRVPEPIDSKPAAFAIAIKEVGQIDNKAIEVDLEKQNLVKQDLNIDVSDVQKDFLNKEQKNIEIEPEETKKKDIVNRI